ncbi:hypothetical protein BKA80DRAFT_264536 [Phyllosticta citrichinensis]
MLCLCRRLVGAALCCLLSCLLACLPACSLAGCLLVSGFTTDVFICCFLWLLALLGPALLGRSLRPLAPLRCSPPLSPPTMATTRVCFCVRGRLVHSSQRSATGEPSAVQSSAV